VCVFLFSPIERSLKNEIPHPETFLTSHYAPDEKSQQPEVIDIVVTLFDLSSGDAAQYLL
jgi:hypothetical protein